MVGVLLASGWALAQEEMLPSLKLEWLSAEELSEAWIGRRESWTESGVTTNFDATYVFQGVADGGFTGRRFVENSCRQGVRLVTRSDDGYVDTDACSVRHERHTRSPHVCIL